ncbi:hypothetical protein LTR56_027994, partial [Elasticomyces elasticus]
HPDKALKLLEQGTQREQYENDKVMEEIVALSRSARNSDNVQANAQISCGQDPVRPSADREALKLMTQAMTVALSQSHNIEVY